VSKIEEEDLRKLLRQRPFQPFRVRLSDGRTFDILHPEMNLVSQGYFDIGVPEKDVPDPFADHFVFVPLKMVAQVEPLPAPKSVSA
jgi:hypothetical protein